MLERITDTYCFWQAKQWIKYKSRGALQAVGDYLISSALGLETTFGENWRFCMHEADDKIYGSNDLREVLVELGVMTEDEVLEQLHKVNREIHLPEKQISNK